MHDRILWIDCIGALLVGAVVFFAFEALAALERLPVSVVLSMSAVNLVYGAYSLFVTTRSPRPALLVKVLAIANMFWLVICVAIAITYRNQVSGLGLLHVLGEGVYVACLGAFEWSMVSELSSDERKPA